MANQHFWSKQRVLLTGHTGFKGAWLSLWLEQLGAEVTGLSLAPETEPNLFSLLAPFKRQTSLIGDIRDTNTIQSAAKAAQPTIVIHMAAQALVRRSYREARETFATNVMGTTNLLDALLDISGLRAVLVVTSDKVYQNDGSGRAFVETDPLGGSDPYSASKAATEIVVASWIKSFYGPRNISIATARAGNVIGGGDWSEDRLIPDLWRSAKSGQPVVLRYPQATRPWQHVLEPLSGYLAFVEALSSDKDALPQALNFGPEMHEAMQVGEIATRFAEIANVKERWIQAEGYHPPESPTLVLDASLASKTIGWRPKLHTSQALEWTAEWFQKVQAGIPARDICTAQLAAYERMSPVR